MLIKIRKGLNLPIQGEPIQRIHEGKHVSYVALVGEDYIGLKAKLLVKQGDAVKLGQSLFFDKKSQVNYTSPTCGTISQIKFGEKHKLKLVLIAVSGNKEQAFNSYEKHQLKKLTAAQVKENLLTSGLWVAFRTRPYSKIPKSDSLPNSIFVTAMDTNPLAADPAVVLSKNYEDYNNGLLVLSKLVHVPIYICQSADHMPAVSGSDQFKTVKFIGPHPAGLPGTHIHFLDPVSSEKTVWYIHYQDVIAIGKLFISGHLWTKRVISIAGSSLKKPRLIETQQGACLDDLLKDELMAGDHHIISGSVLSGRRSHYDNNFLGRYHYQVSAIKEENLFNKKYRLNTLFKTLFFRKSSKLQVHKLPFIPLDNFERVMPLDILPSPLLKALLTREFDTAIELGALELDEQDLALCSYICCSNEDYGSALRVALNAYEAESA